MSDKVFNNQSDLFDKSTADLSPHLIRDRLVKLARPVLSQDKGLSEIGLQEKLGAVRDHLTNNTTPNGGVDVTEDLKYNGELQSPLIFPLTRNDIVKLGRQKHTNGAMGW
jgi:hypothetical protein